MIDKLERLNNLLERIENLLTPVNIKPDWSAHAFRWRCKAGHGFLQPVAITHKIDLTDLVCLERQRDEILRNTKQFLAGRGANNILLWGARGTGKSSLIKAIFNSEQAAGLRLIEVEKDDLLQLPDILEQIAHRAERFILFCDDLSFDINESSYKALKAALEGSIQATPDNILIYATSNRRHLLPEFHADNQEAHLEQGELHLGESLEEKLSLSDRFGLWITFPPFTQAQYLTAVRHWITRFSLNYKLFNDSQWEMIESTALRWALARGSRSGRTAWQFARDWTGRM